MLPKNNYEKKSEQLTSDIKVIAETMKEGFNAVDKRFEAVDKRFEDLYRYMDKRFEDMNKRFNMMFTFMNIGFGIIILLTILFKFMQ